MSEWSNLSARRWTRNGKVRWQPRLGNRGLWRGTDLRSYWWHDERADREWIAGPVVYRFRRAAVRRAKRRWRYEKERRFLLSAESGWSLDEEGSDE